MHISSLCDCVMRFTSILTDGTWAEENKSDHHLTPREQYLFSNCSRHGDTLGVILGTPLACLAKLLAQKRFPATNPIKVFLSAGVPVLTATWACVTCLYMSNICWGYLDLLPDTSPFKQRLLEEEESHQEASWCTAYNRVRAITTVMSRDAHVDMNFDLSNAEFLSQEEKHDIQRQLRWVPPEKYRLSNRLKEQLSQDELFSGIGEGIQNNKNLNDIMKPAPIVGNERIRKSYKALPRGPSLEDSEKS